MKWTIRVDLGHYHAQILALIVVDDSYLRFHTFFTLGPKAQLVPKRRFWTAEKALRVRFSSYFQGFEYSFWATTDLKLVQKRIRNHLFDPRKFFVWGAYYSA